MTNTNKTIDSDYLNFWMFEIFNSCANNEDNISFVISSLHETNKETHTIQDIAGDLFDYMDSFLACEYPTNDPTIQDKIENARIKLWELSGRNQ